MPERRSEVGAIILAAGRSSRMGRPKLLLPWGETTVLGHLLAQWGQVPARQIGVVCAVGDAGMAAELDRLEFPAEARVMNPEPDRGMFSSVQCVARWAGWQKGISHCAVVLGDQPHLRWGTLASMVTFATENSGRICQPSFRGRARHPVFLPRKMLEAVAQAGSGTTLKEFLQARSEQIRLIELDDEGLELDIDRPEDYQRALELAEARK